MSTTEPDDATSAVRAVQGTVASFDPATHEGSVVLDDGLLVPYDAAAFDAGGLRLVRPGQRVRLRLVGARPVLLTLVTLPDP
jgi:hypothetical protein